MELLKSNTIFEKYSNFVSQIASCLDVIYQQNSWNCFSNMIFFFYQSNHDDGMNSLTTRSSKSTEHLIKLESETHTADEEQLMHESKCSICFEHGHHSYECSKKKLDSEVKNLEREKKDHMNETTDLRNVWPGAKTSLWILKVLTWWK